MGELVLVERDGPVDTLTLTSAPRCPLVTTATKDVQEGLRAVRERRRPGFRGR